jgi:UDP-N-acetylmuramate dehydrogenase
MAFGYDTSRLHGSGEIALAVEFALERAASTDLHRVMQENLSWRGSRHPWLEHHPSAGSIFKKIEGVGAGRLVDQCGLKGFRVGDAQISHIHANIVVNLGHATAGDVRALIAHAQAAVLKKFDQRLEPEIGFVGEFD